MAPFILRKFIGRMLARSSVVILAAIYVKTQTGTYFIPFPLMLNFFLVVRLAGLGGLNVGLIRSHSYKV